MSVGKLSPLSQIWLIVFMLMGLQYSLAILVYFGFLGEIFRSKAFVINGGLAVLLSLLFSGSGAVKELFAPYFRLPRNLLWIVLAILWNFPLIMLAVPLNDLLSAAPVVFERPHWIGFEKVFNYLPTLTAVALCDELFWIGFVLPRLLAAGYGSVKASLAIGAFWGLSYVPLIFTKFLVSYGLSVETLALSWFAMAPIYIWLYGRTSSALLVILMCVSMQISNWTVPVLPQAPLYDNGSASILNLLTLVAGLMLWWLFPAQLGAQPQNNVKSEGMNAISGRDARNVVLRLARMLRLA
jgi:hypothetical protein